METALSTISALPSGRDQVARFTRMLKDEILANTKDPLKILVQLKYIEKTIADVLKDKEIDVHFLNEFELYNKEKIVEVNGAKLQTQEVGVKYFYEESGDPEWSDLEKKIQELTEKKKEREKFLQNIPQFKYVFELFSSITFFAFTFINIFFFFFLPQTA
jgi:hypothetical protein